MQHTPIVELPDQKPYQPHRDWGFIILTVVVILAAVLALVMLARPDLLTGTPAVETRYVNPELSSVARFEVERAAAQAVAGPENPELSAANRFVELRAIDQMLRENPEIRRFQNWLEGQ